MRAASDFNQQFPAFDLSEFRDFFPRTACLSRLVWK
jgi:hypothetical protein